MARRSESAVRIRDWKGLMAGESKRNRVMVLVMLAIAAVSMTFMQFGFIGVGANGHYAGYVLGLLAPIAVAALMLGKGWGALTGLVCGAVSYAHAMVQPLDLYESYFVTGPSLVWIYTATGFLLGLLFAVALHNDPKVGRRIGYLCIVCLLVSAFVTACIVLSAAVSLTIRAMDTIGIDGVLPQELELAVIGMGNLDLQLWLDFLLMLGISLLSDLMFNRHRERRSYASALSVFRSRLLVVAILIYMVVQTGAFVTITLRAEESARVRMDGEIDFIGSQIHEREGELREEITEASELPEESATELAEQVTDISEEHFVSMYDLDVDGSVVVFSNEGVVLNSNNPAFPVGSTSESIYGEANRDLPKRVSQTGEMRKTVYSDAPTSELVQEDSSDAVERLQLGYMRAKEIDGKIIMMALPSSIVFAERYATMTWTSILAFILLLAVYLLAAWLLRKVMVNPIDRANASLAKITRGDLDETVSEVESVEFAMLSAGINSTVDSLKVLINDAERRNEADLATAKRIQESALPRTFPPFPEIGAFDIFAAMDAAKEVGGDFYNFFMVDDHTLGFLIADVSGKGIPGALFMMAAKTEIENYLSTGMPVAEAIASANRHLCANNDAGMFVTVWAATLDWETGELTYVNAGHNFPLLRHGFGGEWEWLKKKCGLFLGTFETAKYRQETLVLKPGDELLLYTDGVNEAFSPSEEEYGNDRLEAFLAAHNGLHARELVRSLRADVASWADGAEQSDDVTMLALEYGVAPEVTGTITVPATLDHLDEVVGLVSGELERRLCPLSVLNKVEIALEELFVNVCSYAYKGRPEPGTVQVSYAYGTNPSTITVELRDQGVPFDPVRMEDPTKPKTIQETKVGGLGIYMAKRSMDDLIYMYDDGSNVVVFKKGW